MKIVFALSAALALTACGSLNNQQQGTLIGAGVGGVIGNQVGGGSGKAVATVLGVALGAAVGGNIGKRMDEADQLKVSRALETSPSGRATTWTNPDSKTTYSVTPKPVVQRGNQICREYTTEAIINGREETVTGIACRQPDGRWKAQ